jgi:carboxylesterase
MKENVVILVHGFGGGIFEMQLLADFLETNGYDVFLPILRGHEEERKDIKKYGYTDWVYSVEQYVKKAFDEYESVYFIGFSLGALIALDLSRKYKFMAIVASNTPIYIWNLSVFIKNVFTKRGKYIKEKLKFMLSSPLSTTMQFIRYKKNIEEILKEVNTKILIIQTLDDDTVHHKSAKFVFDNICSTDKHIKIFEKGSHLLFLSDKKQEIFDVILKFLKWKSHL